MVIICTQTLKRLAAIILLLSLTLYYSLPATAEPQPTGIDDASIQHLLEKSLSVVEIDKEIRRIDQEQTDLLDTISLTKKKLQLQEKQITNAEKEAGAVLRAYYNGERDMLLSALVSLDSFSKFFATVELFTAIIKHDRKQLDEYAQQYSLLQQGNEQLMNKQTQLRHLREQLVAQRATVSFIEQQINDELSGRTDADRIRLLIDELAAYWESTGLIEVKTYFKALAQAMKQLPSWIEQNKQFLEINGFQYTLSLPENDLNRFLREQNPIFNNFSFQFSDDSVTAFGKRDEMMIEVQGHYTVENKPRNGIYFHVDKLIFNGLTLPEQTGKRLEKEFNLGFYPDKMVSFMKAEKVEVKDSKLIVKLLLNL